MDIRKSYYDPEMVKNLSVMLRLSPEEVINKLWSNRVPTTITKAMTTEEMLAKNPDSVLSELHAADDRDHADLERRAASRIDPQHLGPEEGGLSPEDDDEIYDIKTNHGPDHGIIGYDSKGNEHESPSSAARAQQEEAAEAKRQRETRRHDGDGEERASARPRLRRSFYPENVARAFAGNPYVGQEFDPATLAGLSRLTGMPVEEVAFKISQSNENMEKGIGDLVSRAANYVKEKVTGAKPAKPETQEQRGSRAYQEEAEEQNYAKPVARGEARPPLPQRTTYQPHKFGNASKQGVSQWSVPGNYQVQTYGTGGGPETLQRVEVDRKPVGYDKYDNRPKEYKMEMRPTPGALKLNNPAVDLEANLRNTRIRNDQLRGQARGETGEIDSPVSIRPTTGRHQELIPNTTYQTQRDYLTSEQHKQRSGGYRKDVAARGRSGGGARSGMAPALGPGEDIHDPKNMMLANSMNGKDKPEMNLEKARQISSMMGIPLDEVLRKLAKAQGIEWEVSKSGGEMNGKDPNETTNPAENTTAERPTTNPFDPGTREGVMNRKTTEIDGKQYNMNTAAAAAMDAARAQGNANLDPSLMESIQDDPHKLNEYVNRQGVRTGESTRNLNAPKPTNKLPNRAPERDNLNLSLVDVFYGRSMSKSKKKINRG